MTRNNRRTDSEIRRRTDSELEIIVGQIPKSGVGQIPNTGVGLIPNSSVGQIQLSPLQMWLQQTFIIIKNFDVNLPEKKSYKDIIISNCQLHCFIVI